jgi:hypothetical protein
MPAYSRHRPVPAQDFSGIFRIRAGIAAPITVAGF